MGNSSPQTKLQQRFSNLPTKGLGVKSIRINQNIQNKYRQHLLTTLQESKLDNQLKCDLINLLKQKIQDQDLVKTIFNIEQLKSIELKTVLHSSRSSIETVISQSTKVKLNFDLKLLQQIRKSHILNPEEKNIQELEDHIELKEKLKKVKEYLYQQFDKSYHPFPKLCVKLAEHICQKSIVGTNDQICQKLSTILKNFASFIINGCLDVYKRYIYKYIQFQGINDKKYFSFMILVILDPIWTIKSSCLYKVVTSKLKKTLNFVKLKVKKDDFQNNFIRNPSQHLQNMYGGSFKQLQNFIKISSPSKMLRMLENVKNQIGKDLQILCKNENTVIQVDGQMLQGILCYLLMMLSQRVERLQAQLSILRIAFGEKIYWELGEPSNMYVSIFSALNFMEKKLEILAQKQ